VRKRASRSVGSAFRTDAVALARRALKVKSSILRAYVIGGRRVFRQSVGVSGKVRRKKAKGKKAEGKRRKALGQKAKSEKAKGKRQKWRKAKARRQRKKVGAKKEGFYLLPFTCCLLPSTFYFLPSTF